MKGGGCGSGGFCKETREEYENFPRMYAPALGNGRGWKDEEEKEGGRGTTGDE